MRILGPSVPLAAGATCDAWAYFGVDGKRVELLKRGLGIERRIETGALVNEVADRCRDELLGFDAGLRVRDELLWQCTDLAERNPFTSGFLYDCCALIAVDGLLGSVDGDVLIAVDDAVVARCLAGIARRRGCAVEVELPPLLGPKRAVHELVRAAGHRVGLVVGTGPRPMVPPLAPPDVLLVTWAEPDSFPADGLKERDTFYGDLPARLRERGLTVGWVAVPVGWVHDIGEIRAGIAASGEWVVEVDACRTRGEALRFALRSLRAPCRPPRELVVGGVDVAPLVRRELRAERAKTRQAWAHGFASVGKALARAGVRPRVVIHLFENQPWEKALRAGLRRHLPGTRIVAYVHTPVGRCWFPYYLSPRDLARGDLPDRLVTTGEAWTEALAAAGFPSERLATGAAHRYGALLERLATPRELSAAVPQAVLVACSIGLDDTLELIGKAVDALPDPDGPRVLVKVHPKSSASSEEILERVRRSGRSIGPHVELVGGAVDDLLARAGAVLYTTTSVSFEALASGVPVVFVESDFWFDIDPGPLGIGLAQAARSPAAIREVVLGLLAEEPARRAERAAAGRAAIRRAFAEVSDAAAEPFVARLG